MAEEQAFMVCMRVDEIADPVDGSTQTACIECGTSLWISPESKKIMHKQGAMPTCQTCAIKLSDEISDGRVEMRGYDFGDGFEMGAPSRGQLREILGAFKQQQEDWRKDDDGNVLDAFDALKRGASKAEMHKPDDQWGSMCIMENYDGLTMPEIPLSKMLDSGLPKRVIAHQMLPALVQAAQVKRVFLGLDSFALIGKPGEDVAPLDGPISEHPDRSEVLVLIEVTADGVARMARAPITRDGISPPKLGEWEEQDVPTGTDGLFVEALVPTLQLVRTLKELESSV